MGIPNVLWRQLRRFVVALILSTTLMAISVACGSWYLWLARQHGQAANHKTTAFIMLTSSMLIMAPAIVSRLRQNPYAIAIVFAFLIPPLFLLGSTIHWHISYFGWWLWGVVLISIWVLLNIPRMPQKNTEVPIVKTGEKSSTAEP